MAYRFKIPVTYSIENYESLFENIEEKFDIEGVIVLNEGGRKYNIISMKHMAWVDTCL